MPSSPVHEQTTLDNGLRVVTQTRPGPAAVLLWLDVGSVDETPSQHGLAHFLEHMLFKGTATRDIGGSAADVEALGGDLNAWTSLDQTVLHATVPTGWDRALDVLVDMARRPRFDADEAVRERDVVLDEIRGYDDDPDDVLSDRIQEALWRPHPYAHRVLGSRPRVATYEADDVRGWLRRHWTADRALVSVVGPASHDEVVRVVTALAGDWAPGEGRPAHAAPTTPASPAIFGVEGAFESTGIQFAWRVPPIGHPDLPALDVLSTLLAQGTGGLLANALHDADDPGFGAWSDLDTRRYGSEFRIGLVPYDDGVRDCVEVVRDVLRRAARVVDGPAVARAKALIAAGFLFDDEDVEDAANDQAWYLAHFDDPDGTPHRRAIAQVTAADVRRVADAWIRPERAVVGVLHGPDDAGTRGLKRILTARPKRATGRTIQRTLGHGTQVVVRPEDTPLVAVHLVAPGGARRTPDRLPGIGTAWSRVVLAGAGRRDARELQDAFDALGASASATRGRHGVGLRAVAPAENASAVLELLGDLALDPELHEDDWARIRDEMLDDVRTRPDRPGEVAALLARRRLWAGHPWRHPGDGTEASLERIGPSALRRWHEQHFRGPSVRVVVGGGVDADEIFHALSWLEDLPDTLHTWPSEPVAGFRPGRTRGHAGQHQAQVAMYGRGHAIDLSRRGLQIASTLLNGQAGRLFLDLRERRALAYDVWAANFEGLDGGSFGVGMSTRPETADEGEAALLAALEDLATNPPTPEELARAKAVLDGERVMSQQRLGARVDGFASALLLDLDPSLEPWRAAVAATTAEDVSREVRAVLDGGLVHTQVLPEP